MMRRQTILFFAVLAVAFAFRLIQLGERNLWYDEAFSALYAAQSSDAILSGTLTTTAGGAADIHPLLYYLSLNLWISIVGSSAFMVRLFSAILGVATVVAVYLVGRDLFDQPTGLVAAFITAIAPFHVQYSQEARMYAMLGFFLTLATWTFIRAYRSKARSWGWWVAFGLFAGLSMHSQQLAAFYLISLALIPVLSRNLRAVIGATVGGVIALALYAPWLLILPSQLSQVANGYWIPIPNVARILLTFRSFTIASLDIPAPQSIIGFVIALVLLMFLFVQILMRRQPPRERRAILLTLWLVFAPMIGLWLVSQIRPIYLDRGLIGSAIMLYVALGWLFTKSGLPRPLVVGLGTAGLAAATIGLSAHYGWSTFPNSPYRQMTDYVRTRFQPGDVIVHQDKTSAIPAIFYARDLAQRYLQDEPGAPDDTLALPTQQALGFIADSCIQSAGRGASRIWWVIFSFAPDQYAASGVNTLERAQEWLNENFTTAETLTLRDLQITLFADRHPLSDEGECAL